MSMSVSQEHDTNTCNYIELSFSQIIINVDMCPRDYMVEITPTHVITLNCVPVLHSFHFV